MAELDKLCYSPNGGNLAYHSASGNLIYRGTATPPTPPTPTEYGDAIVIATVSPTYIQGDDISGTGADYRLYVAFNYLASAVHATNTTTEIASSFHDRTNTVQMWVGCFWGYYYEHDAPIAVDITVIQPSSGYIYTTTVQGNLHETIGQETHNGWNIAITGDSLSRITSVSVIPRWTIQ
jgi:hypothetical protein